MKRTRIGGAALWLALASACGKNSEPGDSATVVGDSAPLASDSAPAAGDSASCQPDCAGRVCGDDGCGGDCGDCGEGEACDEHAGQCECVYEACADACCEADEVCREEACCLPDCAGRVCGDDGCGGDCGDCEDTWADCVDGECLWSPQEGTFTGPDELEFVVVGDTLYYLSSEFTCDGSSCEVTVGWRATCALLEEYGVGIADVSDLSFGFAVGSSSSISGVFVSPVRIEGTFSLVESSCCSESFSWTADWSDSSTQGCD